MTENRERSDFTVFMGTRIVPTADRGDLSPEDRLKRGKTGAFDRASVPSTATPRRFGWFKAPLHGGGPDEGAAGWMAT